MYKTDEHVSIVHKKFALVVLVDIFQEGCVMRAIG